MHHSFHTEGLTDLAVIRDQAQKRAMDRREPESTVVHVHPYDDNGELCENKEHFVYKAGEGLVG